MLIAYYNGEELTSAKVVYPLETPVETPILEQYLGDFWELHSNNPCTTITNNADANMEVDCFLAQHEAGLLRLIEHILYRVKNEFNL